VLERASVSGEGAQTVARNRHTGLRRRRGRVSRVRGCGRGRGRRAGVCGQAWTVYMVVVAGSAASERAACQRAGDATKRRGQEYGMENVQDLGRALGQEVGG